MDDKFFFDLRSQQMFGTFLQVFGKFFDMPKKICDVMSYENLTNTTLQKKRPKPKDENND